MLRTPASLRRLSLAVSTTSKAFDPQAGLASVGTGALLRSATVMSALRLPGGTAIAQSTLQAATTSPAAAALVGATASGRFVGGATLDDAKRTAAALAEERLKGLLLAERAFLMNPKRGLYEPFAFDFDGLNASSVIDV